MMFTRREWQAIICGWFISAVLSLIMVLAHAISASAMFLIFLIGYCATVLALRS